MFFWLIKSSVFSYSKFTKYIKIHTLEITVYTYICHTNISVLSIEIKTCKSYKLLNIISRYQRWEVIQILSDCTYVDFFTFYFSCLHLNKKHLHFLLLSFSNQPRYFSFNAFKGNYYVYCIYIYYHCTPPFPTSQDLSLITHGRRIEAETDREGDSNGFHFKFNTP